MKRIISCSIIVVAALSTTPVSAQKQAAKSVPPELEDRLKRFFSQKEAQAHALADQEKQEQAPDVWKFFAAGKEADWSTVASLYRVLRSGAYQYDGGQKDKRLATMAWQPLNEAFGAYDGFAHAAEDYVRIFGHEILNSMPPGSIYFGGTDPGRWLVTAFCKSHPKADPCFVLTQNALADGLYLKYVSAMYGDRIVLPTEQDSKKAFDEYLAEAKERSKQGKLKTGENFKEVDGKPQVSGQVAVMEINARLVRTIFEANPGHHFFVEESFPLDWMYPHLSPNGLIMKLNRQPPSQLSAETVQKDRDYWTWFTDRALGPWLTPETPVKDVCEFAETVFERKEPGDSDPRFVRNSNSCKTFSKLRSSIGGAYAWRWHNTKSAEEKQRMAKAADFAFRQAFALCPYSPEAVFRYTKLLVDQGRKEDASLIAQTAQTVDPRNKQFADLLRDLEDK